MRNSQLWILNMPRVLWHILLELVFKHALLLWILNTIHYIVSWPSSFLSAYTADYKFYGTINVPDSKISALRLERLTQPMSQKHTAYISLVLFWHLNIWCVLLTFERWECDYSISFPCTWIRSLLKSVGYNPYLCTRARYPRYPYSCPGIDG
jgi:hypothetical protein